MEIFRTTLEKLLGYEDLSFEEAGGAMDAVMRGEVSEPLLAAWLTALRMKGETAAEIAGCAETMRRNATPVDCAAPDTVDVVGTGGDGAKTINVSTAAALVAAGAGATVAKHGNKAVSSASGSADVLEALGVNINLSPERMRDCLAEVGIAFLFAPLLHPAMKYAMPVRRELGVRTVFNILGPLTNPARPRRTLLGVYSPKLCRLMGEAAIQMGAERFIVVHGAGGLDEISLAGETAVFDTATGGESKLTPADFGVDEAPLEEIRGGPPAENAAVIEQILTGKLSGPKRDVVVVNAAAALVAAGRANTWRQGAESAAAAIDSGAAIAKLEALRRFTKA